MYIKYETEESTEYAVIDKTFDSFRPEVKTFYSLDEAVNVAEQKREMLYLLCMEDGGHDEESAREWARQMITVEERKTITKQVYF